MKITDFDSLIGAGSAEEPHAPTTLNGRELEDLVSPMTSGEFINSHFSRASLYAKGTPQKFDHIFNWCRLKQALATGEKLTDRRYNITAAFTGGEDSGNPRRVIEAQHNRVIQLLNAGATICITNIHMADPALARWAQAIRAQLNFTGTVGVNCYVSPDAYGLPMYYDKRVATTLQIAGTKRWKFSTEPEKAWPDITRCIKERRARKMSGSWPDALEFREVKLNPGDLLCLPAGTWHSARGIGFHWLSIFTSDPGASSINSSPCSSTSRPRTKSGEAVHPPPRRRFKERCRRQSRHTCVNAWTSFTRWRWKPSIRTR